jgi:DNA invertase Pin-like site-specific DNA recombinase
LDAVRFLKSLGVAVFFERENIRWSLKKRFRRGKVTVTTKRFLGYDTGENGELVVNPVEAEIVKRIFKEYIAGKSIREIKNGLEDEGIKTVTGLDKWPEGTIRGVLTNE